MAVSKFDLRNLNYYFALSIVGATLSLWLIFPWFRMLINFVGQSVSEAWQLGITWLTTFAVITFYWVRRGWITPVTPNPCSELRFRIGNMLVLAANFVEGISWLTIFLGEAFVHGFGVAVGFILAGAWMLSIPMYVIGIICIETSW
jgi:hypothetical protein